MARLPEEDWITVAEAAQQKGVSTSAVYARIKDGLLGWKKWKSWTLVRRSEVDRWAVDEKRREIGKLRRSGGKTEE